MSNVSEEETPRGEIFDLRTQISNFATDVPTKEALCFVENLLICAKNNLSSGTKPIGGYCIAVEQIGPESKEFLVNVAASMNVEGCFAGGSKLIGSVTENFQCLEEKRNEFLRRSDGTYEKCIFIGWEDDSYHVKVQTTCPCDSSSHCDDISSASHPKLLTEAGNIVLMRYLALTNYHGSFTLESMTIDGKIEISDYKCDEAKWMKLGGSSPLEIYTVQRRNRSKDVCQAVAGQDRESKTLLTRQGRILRHDWLNVPFLLRINPLVDPRDKHDRGVRQPLRNIWSEDLELLAKYLDRKTCTVVQQTNYFADHPEIKKLVADYSQILLIVKPVDVIDFTIQHFRSFAPNPESLQQNNSSP